MRHYWRDGVRVCIGDHEVEFGYEFVRFEQI